MNRFVFAIFLAGSACPAQSDVEQVDALIASAGAETNPEAKAMLLRRAHATALTIGDHAKKANLLTKVRKDLHRVDPNWAKELRARDLASRDLVVEALSDIKNGWTRMARVLLDLADRLEPGSGVEARAKLGEGGDDGPKLESLHDIHFGEPFLPMGDTGWSIEPTQIVSPKLQGKTVLLGSSTVLSENFTIEAEFVFGEKPTKLAIAFGYTPEGHYHLFEVHSAQHVAELRLFRWDGRQMLDLGRQLATFTRAERAGFLPLRIRVEGNELNGSVGAIESVSGKSGVDTIEGRFGFFASKDSPNQDSFRARLVSVQDR